MMAGRMRASKAKAPGLLRAETSSLRMFANFSLRLVRAIAGKVRSAEYRPRADGGLAKVVTALSAARSRAPVTKFSRTICGPDTG